MNGLQYTLLAYAAGMGLPVAYGLSLWVQLRGLRRRNDGGGDRG
jgi:hypothetical protein